MWVQREVTFAPDIFVSKEGSVGFNSCPLKERMVRKSASSKCRPIVVSKQPREIEKMKKKVKQEEREDEPERRQNIKRTPT